MSVKLMSAVFDAKFPEVEVDNRKISPSTLKIVLLSLADHANDEGRSIYPSVARLSRMTGLKDRSVQRAVAGLVKLGLLHSDGFSRLRTNEWRISIKTLLSYEWRRTGESGTPGGESSTPGGVNLVPEMGESSTPKPSLKTRTNKPSEEYRYSKSMFSDILEGE